MRFDLIGPGYTGFTSQLDPSRSVNFYIAPGAKDSKAQLALLGTPGTVLRFNTGNAPIRGMHVFGSNLYVVAGSQLYSISPGGAISKISGAVLQTSVSTVVMKDNGLQVSGTGGNQLMIADGAAAYVYNPVTPSWTPSSSFLGSGGGGSCGFPSTGALALEYIDGYFIVSQPGSMNIFSSDLYNGTYWSALAVASAQAAADWVQAFINMQEQLCIIKQRTTEFWYNTGTATTVGFPFSRQSAAVIDYGTPAPYSVSRGSGSIFMLASRRTNDGPNFIGAVRITNDSPTVITPPAITKQMQAWAPWTDVIAFCYEQDGHSFWQVTSPSVNQTFVYDATVGDPMLAWHERSTYISGSFYAVNRHVANCYAYFNGMHLVGDWETGNIYELRTDVYQDNGNPLIAVRTAQAIADKQNSLKSVMFHRLVLDAQVGVGGNVAFSWSDDGGNTWSSDYVNSMRAVGDYRGIDPWQPLGLHPYSFIPRIMISDPVPRAVFGAFIE